MDTDAFINQLTAQGARKPLPHPLAVAGKWLALLAVYFIVITVALGLRQDIASKWMQPLYLMELSGMLATAITAAIAASFLALPDIGGRPWLKFIPFAPLMVLVAFLLQSIVAGNAMPLIECIKLQKYACLLVITLFSIIPSVFMFIVIRRAAPTRCCWAGSMAGLSVASLGYVLLRLIDNSDDPTALIIWHFIPVMVITMVGMVVGKFYFRHSALLQ
ncbi:MAG: DUF1109 domain-containing protein [Rickettsiales bacterium]